MNKPYKNIITDKIVSFARYIILAEYETKEEAEKNLKSDVATWVEEHKKEKWYKRIQFFIYNNRKEVSYCCTCT